MSKHESGFTLIELMVSISVIVTIVAIAVPSMQLMQANSRMASAANDLATDLKRGRSGAISNRNNFTVSAQTGGWTNGWQATYPVSSSAAQSATPTQQLVLQKLGLPPSITITQTVNPLIFNGTTGRVTNSTGESVDVTFKVCASNLNSEKGFDVLLNRFGRVLIQRHADNSSCNG